MLRLSVFKAKSQRFTVGCGLRFSSCRYESTWERFTEEGIDDLFRGKGKGKQLGAIAFDPASGRMASKISKGTAIGEGEQGEGWTEVGTDNVEIGVPDEVADMIPSTSHCIMNLTASIQQAWMEKETKQHNKLMYAAMASDEKMLLECLEEMAETKQKQAELCTELKTLVEASDVLKKDDPHS